MRVCTWVCSCDCRCPRRSEALDSLKLELGTAASCLTWAQGTELRSSESTASVQTAEPSSALFSFCRVILGDGVYTLCLKHLSPSVPLAPCLTEHYLIVAPYLVFVNQCAGVWPRLVFERIGGHLLLQQLQEVGRLVLGKVGGDWIVSLHKRYPFPPFVFKVVGCFHWI